MGITRGYGHNIDGFESVLRKRISSLKGHLHKSVNTIVAFYLPRVSCCQVPIVLTGIWKL